MIANVLISWMILFTTIAAGNQLHYTTLSDLKFDENDRLAQHYLIYGNSDVCRSTMEEISREHPVDLRQLASASGQLAELLFHGRLANEECPAVCIDRGSMKSLIQYIVPEKSAPPLSNTKHDDISQRQSWMLDKCQRAEFGFINWTPNNLVIYWINHHGDRIKVGDLMQREANTQWQTTVLGHKFEVVDESNNANALVASYIVEHDAFNVIGDAGTRVIPGHDVSREVKDTLSMEWHRHNRVQRTFTELGFNKGRMPNDLWNSMATYYYNNRGSKVREEWDSKGLYVNWWDVNAYMIGMPWALKTYWQSRLKLLVEAWSDTELELTDIYGMRRYEDGARLLTHVDREATHAASLIINVAQGGMREDWPVEIYDHANRLHEVVMQEGDIVYYESAKCLHGRMKPLRGGYYVNLFAHYRPIGDPKWFEKPNPPGSPEPLLDLTGRESSVPFLSKAINVPTTLSGAGDLMDHWRNVEPSAEEIAAANNYHLVELDKLRTARETIVYSSLSRGSGGGSPHSEL